MGISPQNNQYKRKCLHPGILGFLMRKRLCTGDLTPEIMNSRGCFHQDPMASQSMAVLEQGISPQKKRIHREETISTGFPWVSYSKGVICTGDLTPEMDREEMLMFSTECPWVSHSKGGVCAGDISPSRKKLQRGTDFTRIPLGFLFERRHLHRGPNLT